MRQACEDSFPLFSLSLSFLFLLLIHFVEVEKQKQSALHVSVKGDSPFSSLGDYIA